MNNSLKFLAVAVSILLLSCGCSGGQTAYESQDMTTEQASATGNVFMDAEVHVVEVDTGSRVYTRAYIVVDKETAKNTSHEDFAYYLQNKSRGKHEYFTIDFGDSTGIYMKSCNWKYSNYGPLDEEGKVDSSKSFGHLRPSSTQYFEYIPEVSQASQTSASPTTTQNTLTLGQQNAIKQANTYLNVMAFSRKGLIEQLEYEGYSNSDATYAVDHITVDWNEQAAKKAQAYLDIMAFSRDSLIDQLKYDGFNSSQAEYGVKAVGY